MAQILLNQKEIARVTYQANNLIFQQIATRDLVQKNALNLISSQLRLEPASSSDTILK